MDRYKGEGCMLVRIYWARQIAIPVALMAWSSVFAHAQVPALSPQAIVERMVATKALQARQLQSLDVVRDYRVDYKGFGGSHHAEMQVMSTFISPNKKEFRVISQSGSKFLLDRIVNKLLESEKDYQLDEADSDLSSRNYDFKLLGTDRVAGNDAYVMEITPRRKAKYLCRGKIWINARDFAIVRLEGEPAKNPSFWVSHIAMANTYQKVGDFWLPVHKDATTDVRLGGKAVLAIDFSGYRITQNYDPALQASSWRIPALPRPERPSVDRR